MFFCSLFCLLAPVSFHFEGVLLSFFSGEGGDVGGEVGGVEFNDLNASRKPARMG